MNQTRLHVPPPMWRDFQREMQAAKTANQEVIGFFFCSRQQLPQNQTRYLPQAWVVPGPDCYEYQTATGLVLKQEFHLYLLDAFLKKGLDIVHVHTHPGNSSPHFSTIDDSHESEYARFLGAVFPNKPHLISGIFDESLNQPNFRLWNQTGTSFKTVDFYSSWFDIPQPAPTENETESMFDRQVLFGDKFQKQLGEMTVTLIGCGGIGAVFAEQLGRLGVKNWIFIDGDRLETTNLNRMPGATLEMAEAGIYKVEYLKHLIEKIHPNGSRVEAIPEAVENQTPRPEIAASDLIVVATDNHRSRQLAQELAIALTRPLLSLGTHIDIQPDCPPRMYCRVTLPPLGGNWCLMCGNIISLGQAALEAAPREIEELAHRAGYIEGINNPSVFWLNSICASTAVGVVQGILNGFLKIDFGLDWIYRFPESQWHKTDAECLANPGCYFCGGGKSR